MNSEVEDYFAAVPGDRREKIDSLDQIITRLFPGIHVDMKYKMPTYQWADGWVAIANQKNYVSLCTCGYHHIEAFKQQHPGIKTGKGCINFRDRDDLPVADIEAVVQHAIEHPK